MFETPLVPALPTSSEAHQSPAKWEGSGKPRNLSFSTTFMERSSISHHWKAGQTIDSKCPTGRGYVSSQEAEVCCCFRYQKKSTVLQLMDSSTHPYSWEADLWWKSHTVLQTSLSWAYAKSSPDRALGKPPRSVNVNFACQLCRDVSHRSCEPREKKTPRSYFPLNPGFLIRILISWSITNPYITG